LGEAPSRRLDRESRTQSGREEAGCVRGKSGSFFFVGEAARGARRLDGAVRFISADDDLWVFLIAGIVRLIKNIRIIYISK
jgi:hypothetical protein